MRPIALVLAVLIAAPSSAQFAPLALPDGPRRIDYVETRCSGGIAGIQDVTRVTAAGEVLRSDRRLRTIRRARASGAEVRTLLRALDRARFERRSVPPPRRIYADGITCTLTRRKAGRVHSVSLPQERNPAIADLREVQAQVAALGRRADDEGAE